MKKLSLIILIIAVNLSLFSCSVEDDLSIPQTYNTEGIIVEYNPIDYEIVALINDYRASLNLNPLSMLNEASKEAIAHNAYMINQGTISHDFFYIRSQNLKDAVEAKKVLENVGYGFYNAESVVTAWLNSYSHRENIENPNVTDFGISSKQDENGKYYFTNIFVKL
ncbi:CAP domain-containing protein [uncultured Winogradskyella sp.]|uniref:CAP domain-containing protein n=1 Tax=uncultured Winogradskyella sp. TaxID=395353 RepID=UPI002633B3E4|nr:CAP domain-containing protein [uncultured Winogradskyella sp.]|tara:strand:+ start:63 stop:560 length:498 start_codon:yes stop_codon:yes gene_type:complete